MKKIYYKKGYKYILDADYCDKVTDWRLIPGLDIKTDFIELTAGGDLLLKKYYASDGPSGLTVDTANFMRGAYKHDAFFQLMRMGLLDRDLGFPAANDMLRDDCKADGMGYVRRSYVHFFVSKFAKPYTFEKSEQKRIEAP